MTIRNHKVHVAYKIGKIKRNKTGETKNKETVIYTSPSSHIKSPMSYCFDRKATMRQ